MRREEGRILVPVLEPLERGDFGGEQLVQRSDAFPEGASRAEDVVLMRRAETGYGRGATCTDS